MLNKYISLLRGINIAGKRVIKMASLRTLYQEIQDLHHVQTYIQSGNVLFLSTKDKKTLCQEQEALFQKTQNWEVPVIMKTAQEWTKIITNNPFSPKTSDDSSNLYVAFLHEIPKIEQVKKLQDFDAGKDQFEIKGNLVYISFPEGYSRTKLTNSFFEKRLQVHSSIRNWRTINKLQVLVNALPFTKEVKQK